MYQITEKFEAISRISGFKRLMAIKNPSSSNEVARGRLALYADYCF